MRLSLVCVLALALACGDDVAIDAGDATVNTDATDAPPALDDAQADVPRDVADVPVDVFTPRPPPACDPLPTLTPPACGTGPAARASLIPGAADPGFDGALAAEARVFDRTFHAIAALHTGANTEVDIAGAPDRAIVEEFLRNTDEWDLAVFAGRPVESFVSWRKVAGAYGGVGLAADAYRYAVLRDEGAPCEDVERARGHVVRALDAAHRALSLTGAPGVIARGYQRTDMPAANHTTVPLFDEDGDPLPADKDNGTWRTDQSGESPEYDWEDSCSRDMLIGWVFGLAALHEVIAMDPSFDEALKARLRGDGLAIAESLMSVGDQGRDLEIHDADGRITFHGFLHEDAIDRVYIDGFAGNSQHAVMALGIMAALAHVSEDAGVASYVYNELVRRRQLHELVRRSAGIISVGVTTNYSNFNMAFTGGWLGTRYLCDGAAREAVSEGIRIDLYGSEGNREPAGLRQSFFDIVVLAAASEARVGSPGNREGVDMNILAGALDTLGTFPRAPHWNAAVENCDDAEVEALSCLAVDGTTRITLLEQRARGGHAVADAPLPMDIRPPSNFYWRSDPHRVNVEGSPATLLPGVDFRIAYWMGRYLTLVD